MVVHTAFYSGVKMLNNKKIAALFGFVIILVVWYSIYLSGMVSDGILPSPHSILFAFPKLHYENALIRNAMYSIKLNILGYIEAIAIALPVGFIMGLSPTIRKLFSSYVDAIRFVPLTACVGLFIAWWGIDDAMKIQFLAFGIFVYLLPVVVQRVDEVNKTYIDMVYTLGASKFQTIWSVYIPSVLSRISDDIRVLTAISWTYLIVAELVNKTGGLGAMSYTSARQSRVDEVFAILLVIILIGILQDKIFRLADHILFPSKNIDKK